MAAALCLPACQRETTQGREIGSDGHVNPTFSGVASRVSSAPACHRLLLISAVGVL